MIALAAPPLAELALHVGELDYFSLMTLGLVAATVLARGSLVKAVAMVLVGILLGLVGTDVNSGMLRFTFGVDELVDGVSFVALVMGVFGVAEILANLEAPAQHEVFVSKVSHLYPTRDDLRRSAGPIARGTLLGSALGILPGGGALLASFGSYMIEKKIARDPSRFGNGAIEGVAGPESANNAGAQASFIPMLTLGIPSNVVMALMIGALMIQGIAPGPNVMSEQPELFWSLIVSMWVGNLMLVVLNLPLIGIWIRVLQVPYRLLYPSILGFMCVGVYSLTNNAWDCVLMAGFGLFGFVCAKLDCEPAPMVLGFVLGPMMEESLRRGMVLARGDPSVLLTRPLSATFLALAVLLLVIIAFPRVRKGREDVFVDEG
ncbi:MAG: tripartite tricarboxylate transporter permease [Burkholderiales bacterium]|nr:MAG: tripartite tricarboxylate transporter permease [Burkholderiales bacterium]